jgi:hypothetical protein
MPSQSDNIAFLGELYQIFIRRWAGRAALGGEQLNHHRRILPIAKIGDNQSEEAKKLYSNEAHKGRFLNRYLRS